MTLCYTFCEYTMKHCIVLNDHRKPYISFRRQRAALLSTCIKQPPLFWQPLSRIYTCNRFYCNFLPHKFPGPRQDGQVLSTPPPFQRPRTSGTLRTDGPCRTDVRSQTLSRNAATTSRCLEGLKIASLDPCTRDTRALGRTALVPRVTLGRNALDIF